MATVNQEELLQKQRNNNIFQIPDSNLWLITARDDEEHGCRANGALIGRVACASLPTADKARVTIIISNDHLTTQIVQRTRRFALHLLDAKQTAVAEHFGYSSGHNVEKFNTPGVPFQLSKSLDGIDAMGYPQLPIVDGTCGWMECVVTNIIEFPDSTLFVGAIQSQNVFATDQELSSKFTEIASVVNECTKWPMTRRLLYNKVPDLFQRHRQNIAKDIVSHHAKIEQHAHNVPHSGDSTPSM